MAIYRRRKTSSRNVFLFKRDALKAYIRVKLFAKNVKLVSKRDRDLGKVYVLTFDYFPLRKR